MRVIIVAFAGLALTACASTAPRTGALKTYAGLAPDGSAVRAKIARRTDEDALASVRRVRIEPTRFATGAGDWLTEAEQRQLLREVDAQLCFEISERYEIARPDADPSHTARAFIAEVAPTGQLGSAVAAATSFFIPGPIGLRAPAGRGGLAAEAELLDAAGRQIAAITWSRQATVVGTDDPSLSRIGDALQFAEPFADSTAAAMTAKAAKTATPKPDPCAEYGPRIRPEGWITKFATGLYVPQMSGAAAEKDQD